MASDRAIELAKQTGAIVYWQTAEDSAARIASDIAVSDAINAMIAE
jgi:hypothetical protein